MLYDLPEEFSHLQAQDMSRIGFISDVIRGIRKLITGGGTVYESSEGNTERKVRSDGPDKRRCSSE